MSHYRATEHAEQHYEDMILKRTWWRFGHTLLADLAPR